MKPRTSIVFAACLSILNCTQVTAQSADADWQAFQAATAPNVGILQLSPVEQRRAFALREETIVSTALHFFDSHPDDPRKWDAALALSRTHRSFLTNADATRVEDMKYDTAAQEAWRKEALTWREKILASTDATENARAGAEADVFMRELENAVRQMKADPVFDLQPLRLKLDQLLARHPMASAMRAPVDIFIRVASMQNPAAPDTLWREFARLPNPAVRDKAMKSLQMIEAKSKPLELSFTAFDGREVDLSQLRGRVVLIDFWATWCGPCVAELPNVRAVYEAFHDKGFEVVGVSLDLEHDRGKLTRFLKENNMPWPQYFDGKGWKNDLATRYGINGIPAMFLLNQEGKVVSTNARGEKLEKEVRSLLQL